MFLLLPMQKVIQKRAYVHLTYQFYVEYNYIWDRCTGKYYHI